MMLDAVYVEPKVEIECILTYNNDKEQEFCNIYVPVSKFSDEDFVKDYFEDDVKDGLVKVSMCFYTKRQDEELKNYDLPDWYEECNGKLFWEENINF